ncbi:MAG: hypothetical protein ACK52X_03490, partial [bacterium]
FMVVGQATNNGGDYWVREFIHSCWSGVRRRRTSPTTAERRTSSARGAQVRSRLSRDSQALTRLRRDGRQSKTAASY